MRHNLILYSYPHADRPLQRGADGCVYLWRITYGCVWPAVDKLRGETTTYGNIKLSATRSIETPTISTGHATIELQRDAKIVEFLCTMDERIFVATLKGRLQAGVTQSCGERPVAIELSAQRELQGQRALMVLMMVTCLMFDALTESIIRAFAIT